MTNYEKIKCMNIEKMIEFIIDLLEEENMVKNYMDSICFNCKKDGCPVSSDMPCIYSDYDIVRSWLLSENV